MSGGKGKQEQTGSSGQSMGSQGIEHTGREGKGEEHVNSFSELNLWPMGKTKLLQGGPALTLNGNAR